jgi:hypothetical protein
MTSAPERSRASPARTSKSGSDTSGQATSGECIAKDVMEMLRLRTALNLLFTFTSDVATMSLAKAEYCDVSKKETNVVRGLRVNHKKTKRQP